jgi:hypothetical protein
MSRTREGFSASSWPTTPPTKRRCEKQPYGVHLVDDDGELHDAQRARQEGVLLGLSISGESGFELARARVDHQDRHIRLRRSRDLRHT